MANKEHFTLLQQSVHSWNEWRTRNPQITPDLSGANLTRAYFWMADLREANLRGATTNIGEGYLLEASFIRANLSWADLKGADLSNSYLWKANLTGAILVNTNLKGTELQGATMPDGTIHR